MTSSRQKEELSVHELIKNEYKPWLVIGLLLITDLLSISSSFLLSFFIRKSLIPSIGGELRFEMVSPLFIFVTVFIIGIFSFSGFYPGHGHTGVTEFKEIILIVSFSYAVVGLITFILGYGPQISRLVFLMNWVFSLIFLSSARLVLHNRGSLESWWGQPAVVIGDLDNVRKVINYLQAARRIAYKPIAAVLLDKAIDHSHRLGVPIFEYSLDTLTEIQAEKIQLAIITNRTVEIDAGNIKYFANLSHIFPKIIYLLGDTPLSLLSMKALDLDGHPALRIQYNLLNPLWIWVKRILDLIICFFSIILVVPLFIWFSLLIWIDTPGPIIYSQKRMGKGGKLFNIYKFRTMKKGSDENIDHLLKENQELMDEFQTYHKLRNDPRITRVGKILRRTSFDEFPQIWNVLRGEMSWVGPRAYLPSEFPDMGGSAQIIHRVSPGLTGWWQVMGRHNLSFTERLKLDEYYISNFSIFMDLYILFKTIFIVISGNGI